MMLILFNSILELCLQLGYGKDVEFKWVKNEKPDLIIRSHNLKAQPRLKWNVP